MRIHCQQQNLDVCHLDGIAVLASAEVRRRPIYFKQLGEYLVAERERRQWQQAQAAELAQRRGLTALTRQVLLRLENGQTKSPDPKALRAVADLYGLDYSDLVARMMSERYGAPSDLPRHGRTGQQDSHLPEGESNGPAQTRTRELEDRLAAHEAIFRQLRTALATAVALLGEESDQAAANTTGRRRRHRKTG